MPPEDQERSLNALVDMLISSQRAMGYLDGISIDEFMENYQIQDSVIRRVEIVGEAAKRVGESSRPTLDGMSWQQICGMRDILIHQYNGVDLELVYTTVKDQIPSLSIQIVSFLEAHNHAPDQLDDNPSV